MLVSIRRRDIHTTSRSIQGCEAHSARRVVDTDGDVNNVGRQIIGIDKGHTREHDFLIWRGNYDGRVILRRHLDGNRTAHRTPRDRHSVLKIDNNKTQELGMLQRIEIFGRPVNYCLQCVIHILECSREPHGRVPLAVATAESKSIQGAHRNGSA